MAYYRQTAPLIGYYHAKGKLRTVDGLAPIDTISARDQEPAPPLASAGRPLPGGMHHAQDPHGRAGQVVDQDVARMHDQLAGPAHAGQAGRGADGRSADAAFCENQIVERVRRDAGLSSRDVVG